MKSQLSYLFLFLPVFAFSQTSVLMIHDSWGNETYAQIYSEYTNELHKNLVRGEISMYDNPSLKGALNSEALHSFFTQYESLLLPVDDFTEEWVDSIVSYQLGPSDWKAIRFEKEYLSIQLSEDKIGYITNKQLRKLNPIHTQLLESFQALNNPAWLSSGLIKQNGAALFDSLQTHLYQFIEAKTITPYWPDSVNKIFDLVQFDTLYDEVVDILMDDWDLGYETFEQQKFDFLPNSISGMAVRRQLVETPGAWRFDYTHFGLCYPPYQYEGDDHQLIMVWMDWKEVKKNLPEVEWLLLQEITRYRMLDYPLINSSDN